MKKLAIIVNESAGQGKNIEQALGARANLWGRVCEFHFPSSVEELRSVCNHVQPRTHDALVVMGGDGTINRVIRSFDNLPNSVPILPFPGGTANDFARELNVRADWEQIQTLLDTKQTEHVDLIEVNQIPFVTVGGVGIGATLTADFNNSRHNSLLIRGLSRYLHSQIYTVLGGKTLLMQNDYIHRVRIRTTGFDEQMKTPAIFLCNQTYLGGSLKVAPKIDNTDMRFNVLVATTCMRSRLLKALIQLKKGHLPREFLVFSTDNLLIEDLDGRSLTAFGDGETLIQGSKLEFTIRPKALHAFRVKAEALGGLRGRIQ